MTEETLRVKYRRRAQEAEDARYRAELECEKWRHIAAELADAAFFGDFDRIPPTDEVAHERKAFEGK